MWRNWTCSHPRYPLQTMQSFKCQWNIYSLFIRLLSINLNYSLGFCFVMACRSNDSTFAIFLRKVFWQNDLHQDKQAPWESWLNLYSWRDFWLAGLAWKPKTINDDLTVKRLATDATSGGGALLHIRAFFCLWRYIHEARKNQQLGNRKKTRHGIDNW